jgi:hypothetical protein
MATPTLVWAVTAVATFFLIPLSGSAYFGLAQRIFLTVILTWALTTTLFAGRSASLASEGAHGSASYVLEAVRRPAT